MTFYDYLSCVVFILTIAINSLLVYFQKTRQIYNRFGKRAFLVHSLVLTLVWGGFIFTEFLTANSSWRFADKYPGAGLLFLSLGLSMYLLAIKEIGGNAMGNGYFFGYPLRKLGGIYRFIKEPIYWSYAVWFAGWALFTGQKVFLLYVIISIIGLIGIESRVERP